MRVDLSFRLYAAVNKPECGDRPVEIIRPPVGFPQGQLLAQRRFVYLNHTDVVRFQIEYLFADREADLIGAFLE